MRSEPIDWVVLAVAVCLSLAGLSVLSSFGDGGESGFFSRQLVWLSLSLVVFFIAVYTDWRFMRGTRAAFGIYLVALVLLGLVVVVGKVVHGAQSWFDFGSFSFQPVEFAKLALIVVLAKYFTRRHIEIARVRHVVVSGLYALVLIALLFLQPDFGSAVIVGLVWFALVLCAGMSRLHIAGVLAVGSLSFVFLWFFVFTPQQHARIETFVRPLADVRGAGYNALQSVIAVGSGEVWGKGVGYGTQSRLRFLPEYETDFVFAAFAEEWGFIGSVLLFILFGMLVWRVLAAARGGQTNIF
jgi:rod shape determining protein RodA